MSKVVSLDPELHEVEGNRVGPRVTRLQTIGDVRTEISRLYRRSVKGEIAPSDARHLGTLLTLLLTAIRHDETDRRILALEQRVLEAKAAAKGTPPRPRLVP